MYLENFEMSYFKAIFSFSCILLSLLFLTPAAFAATGGLEGIVLSADSNNPLPGVQVMVVETKQSVTSDEKGHFKVEGLAAGSYTLSAGAASFKTITKKVEIKENETVHVDISLPLASISENVVVTASPYAQSAFKTYQPTQSLSGTELDQKLTSSLGETLKEQIGVNVRTFGTAPARPVIRGFDGDRVLILQDGNRMADISSQSGDHAVPVNPASVARIEIVRGPASLLYGSNAIGGVINTISSEVPHDQPFNGAAGYANFGYGSNNKEGLGAGHVDYGTGSWILHASGADTDSSNYSSADGEVLNSAARNSNLSLGSDYVGGWGSTGFTYGYDNLHYEVPTGGQTNLQMNRNDYQFRNILNFSGPFLKLRQNFGYVDYQHQERDGDVVDTTFLNKVYEYRALLDQKPEGRLSGTIGFSGYHRNYQTVGEEILAPDTIQNTFAGFGYEELHYDQFRLQFGARVESVHYTPTGLIDRTFTGPSASVGILKDLTANTLIAANYAYSYRAPSLEELYNHGPHDGTASFEIGNPNLNNELGNSVDFSLRHKSNRVEGEVDFFYSRINNFVFAAPTGAVEDDLPVVIYTQADSRFVGYEASLSVGLMSWISPYFRSDYVQAETTSHGEPLPRIPPARERIGAEFLFKKLSVSPEVLFVSAQNRVFGLETPTPGYTLLNIRSAYVWTSHGLTNTITASLLNATNEFYLNNLSFIKDQAPEPGRTFRVTYSLNFY